MTDQQMPPVQTVPPSGALGRLMVWIFGASYRTSIAGVASGVSVIAGTALRLCPTLISGHWNTQEVITLVLSVMAGGGVVGMGFAAKDARVSGVETKPSN